MKTIIYKDIPLAYKDQGKGPAVILLHGFLENSHMWDELALEWMESHRIVQIDLLGHGQSGCLGYIHTMEMMADAVIAVLAHLRIGKVTLIGHSMGGYVALAFAKLHPERVRGLCLLNSTALNDDVERQNNRDRAIKAVKQNHRAFISMSIANLFAPDNRERLSLEIENVKQEALKTPLQGIVAALEGMKVRANHTDILHNSDFKMLLIIGLKDPVLDYKILRLQIVNTPVSVVEFPDGHMSYIENRVDLSSEIKYFIN